jgi:hypothetical protein
VIRALLALAAIAATGPLPPEPLGRVALGPRRASHAVDVPSCAVFGHRLFRVRVQGLSGVAHLRALAVIYADGSERRFPVSYALRGGWTTPWLDLAVRGLDDRRCVAGLALEGYGPARVLVAGQEEVIADGAAR